MRNDLSETERTVTLSGSMTVAEAQRRFNDLWTFLTLRFFESCTAYFHEGFYAEGCEFKATDQLCPRNPETQVQISGVMSHWSLRDAVYLGFKIEPEVFYVDRHVYVAGDCIDEQQSNAADWYARFSAIHKRAPGPADCYGDP